METGTRHRVRAHPTRRWLLKAPDRVGTSQDPGDEDKREQLGGRSAQGQSLLRVGAHPLGSVPELSPDQLVSQMEPPVPQGVIPRASVYLHHSSDRHMA